MKTFFLAIILSAFAVNIHAQDIKLTATVDRSTVGLEDNFTYQLEVSGPVKNLPEPNLPDLSNFAIFSGPNVSSSFQIVNFDISASQTYSYVLGPKQVGKYEIPPAIVEYKGNKYRSNSVVVTVTKVSQNQPQTQRSTRSPQNENTDLSESLFLKAVPSKSSVFVNEQVNVSYKVYFNMNIRSPEFIKLPETVGFWVEEYPITGDIPVSQETVNGIQYNVAVIKKMALFPTKTGELSISPLQLRVHVQMQRQRRDPFNVFDDFFNSPFDRMVSKELTSNSLTLNVRPLPESGKPADFSGLVGDFRLLADLDKTNIPSNEAISLKLKIAGTGNLKVLNQIAFEAPPSFEVFDPKVKDEINRDGTYLSGSKEFEYIMIPRVPGEFQLKPVSITYFDPFQKLYRKLSSRPYELTVTKGKELPGNLATNYLSKEDVKLLGKDIHFIKEVEPDFVRMNYSPYTTMWFMLGILLPAIAVAGAFGYRNHLEKVSTNLEYARKRKAHKQARRQLKEANAYLKNHQHAEFYGEISRALMGYVADKTNRSAAGFIRDDVAEIMKTKEVDSDLVGEYFKCLDNADFRRFAPSQNSEGEAVAFYDQAEKILVKLEKYF
jgi:BatD DUF11 like domain